MSISAGDKRETAGSSGSSVGALEIARQRPSVRPKIFPQHWLAHELLDGLSGLEIGAAAHNPFGLKTRNVARRERSEFYAEQQRAMGAEPARVDIWATADRIPVGNRSEDFVLSSHVLEHLPNVVGALFEWYRIGREGGYVFMTVPLEDALPEDARRELTSLDHFIECYRQKLTVETHPTVGVPDAGMGHCHYH